MSTPSLAPAATLTVASFYQFLELDDLPTLRARLRDLAQARGLLGTILLAREGLNASLAGPRAALEDMLACIVAGGPFAPFDVRWSTCAAAPFRRLKIKLKREIVTMGDPALETARWTATHVAPADWNALIGEPDVLLVDTRNDYEVRIGSFAGAVELDIKSFREYPARIDALLAATGARRVAMFCTGGIRCEKASAYLRAKDAAEVYQLEGGILNYLAQVPAEKSRWNGECFVFDDRTAVDGTLAPGEHTLCHGCRHPLDADDRASPLYVEGVSCPRCHASLSAAQRRSFSERRRQELLARKRHAAHLGAVMPPPKKAAADGG